MLIKLTGNIQQPQSQENDTLQVTTIGTYAHRGGITCIRYPENEEAGFGENVYTTLILRCGTLVMTRRVNGNETRLVFEPGKTHYSYYETPFGAFRTAVVTKDLDVNVSEKGGKISVRYGLMLNDVFSGENHLTVELTPDA